MKLLFDLFPVLLFFIAYQMYDIYTATLVIVLATIVQVSYLYIKHKRVEKLHIITLVLVVLLGGLTLILQDEAFIKWKPTIVNWGFAIVFLGSHYIGQKPIIQRMMGSMIELPEQVWSRLSWLWIGFFVISGVANLYVAFNYDTDTWVNFKVFGLMVMTIVFILLQGLYIHRHLDDLEPDELDAKPTEASAENLEHNTIEAANPSSNEVESMHKTDASNNQKGTK